MYVVARDGCRNNLYVELSITDAENTVVGYTNELTGRIDAGQRAKLTFNIFEDGAVSLRPTEMNCY